MTVSSQQQPSESSSSNGELQLSASGQVIDEDAEAELEESIVRLNYRSHMDIQFLLNNEDEAQIAADWTAEEIMDMTPILESVLADDDEEPKITMVAVAQTVVPTQEALNACT
ncbi:hypothetical protein OC834_007324, partial [Tilletia horrida]